MITNDELREFEQSVFTGIIVGVGSLVLLFSSGCRILIQCPFQCGGKKHLQNGHGENLATSVLLFPTLNQTVYSCSMLDDETLTLCFSNEDHIHIIPEKNGFESYVITTSRGDYPVIAC
ncbi:TPA: hypothetical protein ACSW2U_002920 [Enterobacter roggenkampii]|jgi:hypothetical protein|nr:MULTISPECIES: hypothetical protein [Enterobacter]ELS5729404.1 hypothetical protein [Enterobacter roggenkampii]MBQ0301192.1 hypothetical protein [Enterobacter roggenkampii]MCB7505532.1 hypothetical protein [Enterobacter roggenkampii]MCE1944565.1 hypothetical protein [Enterobacter roggenkampii]MCE1975924.1 hypothetical protein [Enterobacter roggenkampii]